MRGFKKLEISTDLTWSTATGSWTEIDINAVLQEATVLAEPERFTTEMMNNVSQFDGVRYRGVIRVELGTSGLPADNTAFWIQATPHSGTAQLYGGEDGCSGAALPTGLRSLSSGRAYIDLEYEMVGAAGTDLIKDAA